MSVDTILAPASDKKSKSASASSKSKKRKLASDTDTKSDIKADSAHAPEADNAAEADDEPEEEIEAISHAEQRKRRKLEKKRALQQEQGFENTEAPAPASATAAEPAKSKTAAKKEEANQHKRSGFGVWVGNLAFFTEPGKLETFFASCGTITRMNMPKGNGKLHHNKGYAYVDFEDQEAVDAAIKLSEGNLDGRRLLIKNSKDYQGRPQGAASAAAAVLSSTNGETSGTSSEKAPSTLSKTARRILDKQKNPPSPTLFLGNLGFEIEEDIIREMFESHAQTNRNWQSKKGVQKRKPRKKKEEKAKEADGSDSESSSSESESEPEEEPEKPVAGIRRIRIGTFEDSGKCKGWAFVDFHLTSSATLSLIDGRNHHLNGRDIKVEYASAEAVRRGGGKMDGDGKAARAARNQEDSSYKGKQPRRDYDEDVEVDEAEEPEAPKQAFYRPPLAANPFTEAVKVHKPNKEERAALREEKKKIPKRQKPGAALADAQREKVAIQPSQGKKITFE